MLGRVLPSGCNSTPDWRIKELIVRAANQTPNGSAGRQRVQLSFFGAGPVNDPSVIKQASKVNKDIYYTEMTGVGLSAIGILLLLVEVWFILVS